MLVIGRVGASISLTLSRSRLTNVLVDETQAAVGGVLQNAPIRIRHQRLVAVFGFLAGRFLAGVRPPALRPLRAASTIAG